MAPTILFRGTKLASGLDEGVSFLFLGSGTTTRFESEFQLPFTTVPSASPINIVAQKQNGVVISLAIV
jgi:hypothetical protein